MWEGHKRNSYSHSVRFKKNSRTCHGSRFATEISDLLQSSGFFSGHSMFAVRGGRICISGMELHFSPSVHNQQFSSGANDWVCTTPPAPLQLLRVWYLLGEEQGDKVGKEQQSHLDTELNWPEFMFLSPVSLHLISYAGTQYCSCNHSIKKLWCVSNYANLITLYMMSQNSILYLPTYEQFVYNKYVVTYIKIYYLNFLFFLYVK